MDTLFPFLIGATGKIYYDIEDLKLSVNPLIIESLKSINLLFFTLTSKNDFMFSLSAFLMSIIEAGIDNKTLWKSFVIVCLVLMFVSFPSFISTNWNFFCSIIIICVLFMYIKEKTIPTEYSIKKIISRLNWFILFLGLYFISPSFFIQKIFGSEYYLESGNIAYFYKLILVCLGGSFISILSQIYIYLWKTN